MPGTPRYGAAHGERAFLTRAALERHVAYAHEHDARFALSGDQVDDFVRYAGGFGRKLQSDDQHFRDQFAVRKPRVGRPGQRQHGDGFDLVHQSLLEFAGNRRFAYEQGFRQCAFGFGNRRETGSPSEIADTEPQ